MLASQSNQQLAHTALRFYMAINIGLHGIVRLPKLAEFAGGLERMFEPTFVPTVLVQAAGYGIPIAEAALGLLLLSGWRVREVAVAGLALIAALTAGMSLLEKWDIVGIQLMYALAYFALIYTAPRTPA